MTGSHSDALVFFGATGDLAYKKIFPALQAMAKGRWKSLAIMISNNSKDKCND
jgi:glucose-6-phosphate 1-dehydrogenase